MLTFYTTRRTHDKSMEFSVHNDTDSRHTIDLQWLWSTCRRENCGKWDCVIINRTSKDFEIREEEISRRNEYLAPKGTKLTGVKKVLYTPCEFFCESPIETRRKRRKSSTIRILTFLVLSLLLLMMFTIRIEVVRQPRRS